MIDLVAQHAARNRPDRGALAVRVRAFFGRHRAKKAEGWAWPTLLCASAFVIIPSAARADCSGIWSRDAVGLQDPGATTTKAGNAIRFDDSALTWESPRTRVRLESVMAMPATSEILWSPSGERASVTFTEGGAVGEWSFVIVSDASKGMAIPARVRSLIGRPKLCDVPEDFNLGAIAWLSEHRLLVAAQVLGHSVCRDSTRAHGFVVDVDTGNVLASLTSAQLTRRYRRQLGCMPSDPGDTPAGDKRRSHAPGMRWVVVNHIAFRVPGSWRVDRNTVADFDVVTLREGRAVIASMYVGNFPGGAKSRPQNGQASEEIVNHLRQRKTESRNADRVSGEVLVTTGIRFPYFVAIEYAGLGAGQARRLGLLLRSIQLQCPKAVPEHSGCTPDPQAIGITMPDAHS